jgi:hypothetical protein
LFLYSLWHDEHHHIVASLHGRWSPLSTSENIHIMHAFVCCQKHLRYIIRNSQNVLIHKVLSIPNKFSLREKIPILFIKMLHNFY